MVRHVLALLGVTGLVLLGRWQWDVSASGRGGLQNLLYAIQWWAVAGGVIYGWWRLLRDDALGRGASGSPGEAPAASEAGHASSLPGDDDHEWGQPADLSTSELIDAQLATPDDTATGAAEDELAQYNRYLAWLNARSERAQ
jgi:hypothetical protein